MVRKALILIIPSLVLSRALESRASILVDQRPGLYWGGPADTSFVDGFGDPLWQELADNFSVTSGATLTHATWWGFYGASGLSSHPPAGDETMRIRLYSARIGDNLPGQILYEQDVLNAQRLATGRNVSGVGSDVPEYKYDVDLAGPIVIEANTTYWFAVEQVGLPSSVFRWSFPDLYIDGQAFVNPNVSDWRIAAADLSFQLSGVPEPSMCVLLVLALGYATAVRSGKEVS